LAPSGAPALNELHGPPRVLIVDDYPDIVDDYPDGREMLFEYLVFFGFPVLATRDGAEAIELGLTWAPRWSSSRICTGWTAGRSPVASSPRRPPATSSSLLTVPALASEVDAARQADCDAVVLTGSPRWHGSRKPGPRRLMSRICASRRSKTERSSSLFWLSACLIPAAGHEITLRL
jgi:hypothetical protein